MRPSLLAVGLGAVGGSLGVLSVVPQVHRLWVRREHEGLSLRSNVLGLVTSTTWFAYAIGVGRGVQIVASFTGSALCAAMLAGQVVLARPRRRTWLPLAAVGVAGAIVLASSGSPAIVGWSAAALSVASVLPQIALLARGRLNGRLDTSGLARSRWVFSLACNMVWLSYAVIVDDAVIKRTALAMSALCTLVLLLAPTAQDAT